MPTKNSLTTLTIVSADGEGLAPIRCSSSALTSSLKDQNRYVASKAVAEATRKRAILLVSRGLLTEALLSHFVLLVPFYGCYKKRSRLGKRLINIKSRDKMVTTIAVNHAATL